MFREDLTSFKQVVAQDTANRGIIEEEMEQAEANIVDQDFITFMEAPATESKHTSTRAVLQSTNA